MFCSLAKNVAADIADKLCESVANKLEGKVLGTFTGITSTVKSTLINALVQLLSPKRRIDILRDVMEAQKSHQPYNIVFCGVNGVGKSTNLAKVINFLNCTYNIIFTESLWRASEMKRKKKFLISIIMEESCY